ncbi:DNA polymerase III subunit alpha [Rickettsiales endosymbiont of Paramecium tredecaurelia]|uniref:DNA polymerase III subunit alpha n=1 Tax=Candidatus Sarmatiella mevalonica TaxID=2770581 RepID=UPI0019247F9A|nr:DNA polymerase III subunit alpha [Candidatus Sarmatiella mevalonica]MBL3285183.1 DNA polymerase III subunit alpha [Candidatus Sarmatiella mevalonica]
MQYSDFVHLRAQSSYSLLASTISIEALIARTKKEGMHAVALTDKNNLFGSLQFAIAAVKEKIQPINGLIATLYHPSPTLPTQLHYSQILLLAQTDEGYSNLQKLNSYSYIKQENAVHKHRIDIQDLRAHGAGIIALSAYTEGAIGQALLLDKQDAAMEYANTLHAIFGDRFYMEIFRHNLPNEKQIEQDYLNLAYDLKLPIVATNQTIFFEEDYTSHDVLLCIEQNCTQVYMNRHKVSNQFYYKTPAQMHASFSDLPEALLNSVYISQRCHTMARTRGSMLPSFATQDLDEEALIRRKTESGLLARLEEKFEIESITDQHQQEQIKTQYFKRLEYELDLICKMDFSGYFLIVSDFISWSKENNIAVGPGRGSGAGSIVAWSLLITDLDPIRFGLIFERFLNPERISLPDFDIDFCQERREEVIHYVKDRYGYGRVGQIITFGKLQAKAVIKDVARVLGLSYKYADYLTQLVPFNAVNPVTLDQAIEEVPELKNAAEGRGLYNLSGDRDLIKKVMITAKSLEGLYRHCSTHAAGIVIAKEDLINLVPLYQDSNSQMLVIQYSMKYAELAGLMKFDFLGLQTLTVITKCKELLALRGIKHKDDTMIFDDQKTYEMLAKGRSTGVFQFESVGMKESLKRLKPDCIDDLIALGALYRPGPMENIPVYIACKHKLQKPNYLHPLLHSILRDTYGVIIYQEQVLEIARVLAGYSLGAADLLRRAMGKKIKSEMDAQEELFVRGALANGVSEEQSKGIFATVAKFAGYGFNRAHASAYGVISYQTAYLKANFPYEFLVSCVNLEINNNEKINIFLQDAQNFGIVIIPPDINKSQGYFYIEYAHSGPSNGKIIYALGAIKHVTPAFGKIVEDEREARGSFTSLLDFLHRIKNINRKVLEFLIKAGTFDAICSQDRLCLLNGLDQLLHYANTYHKQQESAQMSLLAVDSIELESLIAQVEPNYQEICFNELEALGLFIKHHPLFWIKDNKRYGYINSTDLSNNQYMGKSKVKIAGVIQKKDAKMSARGRFIVLQLSDPFGIFELSVFNEQTINDYAEFLMVKKSVVVCCDMSKDQFGAKLAVTAFEDISSLKPREQVRMVLYIESIDGMNKARQILTKSATTLEHDNLVETKVTFMCKAPYHNLWVKTEVDDVFYCTYHALEELKAWSRGGRTLSNKT